MFRLAVSATLSMEAIKAAGTPCPVTSATKMPRRFSSTVKKIVKIAGDRAHGNVARGDIEPDKNWHALRKGGRLNAPRDLEFLVNSEQAFLISKYPIGRNVAKANHKNQKAHNLHVFSGEDMQARRLACTTNTPHTRNPARKTRNS